MSIDLYISTLLLVLINQPTTRTSSQNNTNFTVEQTRHFTLNSSRNSSSSVTISIGVIVQGKSYQDFQKALSQLNGTDLQNVSIVSHVVENNPYSVLRVVCDNFTGNTAVQGLVFVCEDPCSRMTSFASFIGWSGAVVEKRSEDHSLIFVDEHKAFLDLKPPTHLQNVALIELILQFQWSSICLIYDIDHYTPKLVKDLEERINEKTIQIKKKIKLDGNNVTIDTGLKSVKGKIRVFVLYLTRQNAEIVIERANKQQLIDKEHAWIVGEMALENRESKIPDAFPIGLLGIEYDKKDEYVEHIVDAITLTYYGIGHMVHNKTWISTPTGNCVNDTTLKHQVSPLYRAMKKTSFTGRTGKVSFTEDGNRTVSRYNFLNLQQKRNTRKLFWENVGYSENGYVTLEQIVWPGGVVRTPSGIPRVRLRVVMYAVAPLLYVRNRKLSMKDCERGLKCTLLTEDKKELPMCCFGLCIDLLGFLSRDLDFYPDIRAIEGGRAGSLKNGRWTGLIGYVVYGEADMAISSISITEERSKFVDFSAPYLYTGSTILVAKRHGSFKGDGFIKPFEKEAWLLLFGVLYLVAFVVFIFESKNPGLQRTRYKDYAGKFDIHISIWLIYSRLFSGNLDAHVPRFVSSRVVLGSWSFASLMVVALYTANLAAFMVQKEEAHYIDGINDSKIQNPSNSLKFTTILDTSIGNYFKTNYPHIYKFMEKQPKFNHSSEGVKAVRDGTIDAFVWEAFSLEQYTTKDSGCRLLTVGKQFDQTGFAAAFTKNSPWAKNVSEKILKYQASDRLRDLEKRWLSGYCHQKSSNFGDFLTISPLGYDNLMGVFYLLLAGIGLSILVLIGENLLFTLCGKRKKKSTSTTERHTMSEADRTKLQQEVAAVQEMLQTSGITNNDMILTKIEKELLVMLQELYELQTPLDRSLQSTLLEANGDFQTELEKERSHDAICSLTLDEMKQLMATMKSDIEQNITAEQESVV